jgi:hypothetical protein
MGAFILGFLQGIAKRLLTFFLIAAVAFGVWNYYKDKRERKTFVVSFNNIEGLRAGAPVYANGVKVGKVIKIFPVGNSNSVGVKCVITDKNFPSPKGKVNAKLITDYEDGGGKVVEIFSMVAGARDSGTGLNPYVSKYAVNLFRDFLQLSKDFAEMGVRALSSRDSNEYRENIEHNVQNTITSLEYGTLRQDIEHEIKDLNKSIKKFESRSPGDKEKDARKALESQVAALKKTTKTFGTLSDPYAYDPDKGEKEDSKKKKS